MPEPSEADLAAIHAARAGMFRPDWLRRLVAGGLPLGETFWGGHLGMQLILMPLWLGLVVVGPAIWPEVARGFWFAFFALEMVWSLLVTQAVLRVAPRAVEAGGWRWVAMVASLVLSAQALGLLGKMLVDPGFPG